MSWNRGSQDKPRSSLVSASPCGPAIAPTFSARLRWVSTTPFGSEVEPDVNCRKTGSSRRTRVIEARRGPGSRSIASTDRTLGASDWSVPSTRRSCAVVTTAAAPLALTAGAVWRRYASN